MGEVDRLVTQTALAIRDADELEVAASVLDAALRRAKAERERFGLQQGLLIAHIIETGTAAQVIDGINARIAELDARAAQIEEGVNNVENGRADQS